MSRAERLAFSRSLDDDLGCHIDALIDAVLDLRAQMVIELGVRNGTSTAALLYALEQTGGQLWSVDIDAPGPDCPPDPRWTFLLGNDLDPDIVRCLPTQVDLVFIDTDHAYDHTLLELETYAPRVRPGGLVVLHDTQNEDPAMRGEHIGMQPPFPVRHAMQDYCAEHGLPFRNDEREWGLGTIYC